ncbi:MAG: Na+/H+ antiporter subunit E [Chloroflexi bacterium]|nr:Na+/H+ antiporter subunit E [Chloroflexota bacterium]
MIWLNLLLALTWVMITGASGIVDWIIGLVFGFVILWLSWRSFFDEPFTLRRYLQLRTRNPLLTIWRWLRFIGFGFVEIVKSNIAMARAVLAPKLQIKPGIVAIPLDVQSDAGITTLANLITLTPGTVTLDVSSDRKTLYIHTFSVGDPEQLRRRTKAEFERRVLELLP